MSHLTTPQAAELIGIPAGTLRYWRSRGEGPKSFVIGAKRVFYREEDIREWIDSQYAATVTGDNANEVA